MFLLFLLVCGASSSTAAASSSRLGRAATFNLEVFEQPHRPITSCVSTRCPGRSSPVAVMLSGSLQSSPYYLSFVLVSVVVTPCLFVVASPWMCIASYRHWFLFCCCCVCISFMVMQCNLSCIRLCFSIPRPNWLLSFPFLFLLQLPSSQCGSSILILFQIAFCGCCFLFDLFLRVLDIFLRTWMLLCFHLFYWSVHRYFPL